MLQAIVRLPGGFYFISFNIFFLSNIQAHVEIYLIFFSPKKEERKEGGAAVITVESLTLNLSPCGSGGVFCLFFSRRSPRSDNPRHKRHKLLPVSSGLSRLVENAKQRGRAARIG